MRHRKGRVTRTIHNIKRDDGQFTTVASYTKTRNTREMLEHKKEIKKNV